MNKYTLTWGWEPPQYEKTNNGLRIFYNTEQRTKEVTHRDPETEETTETVTEWLCDVIEYNKSEIVDINPDSIEFNKWLLKQKINAYDKSKYVNDFTIGGIHLWLDSTMRSKVRENLETCQQLGETNTTLRFEGMIFPVSVQQGWQMYYSVLAYARDSWNTTENHLATVDKLENLEEIKNYNYKFGYPEKLAF